MPKFTALLKPKLPSSPIPGKGPMPALMKPIKPASVTSVHKPFKYLPKI